jgi:hypothetical protein
MKLIWKNKLFWREETDNNKPYVHPIIALGTIATLIIVIIIVI